MVRLLALIACLAFAAPAMAQTSEANSPDGVANAFFRDLQSGDTTKAYTSIFSPVVISKKQADVENLSAQTAAALKFYGKVLGWELAHETQVSPSYVRRLYVVRTEVAPLFYRFDFYKPSTKWTVVNVFFADQYAKAAD